MKIKTKAFDEIEISDKQKIFFENGILGFEDIHDYVLLDTPEDTNPFYWLQAEKIPEIAFVIIDPRIIMSDYQLDVDPEDFKDLMIEKETEILMFSIVTIYDNPEDMTLNLLGPIIINKSNHYAKQVINQKDEYSIKHPLMQKRGAEC